MAQYLLLIWGDEQHYANLDETGYRDVLAAHEKFGTAHGESIRGGNGLHPAATAKIVREDLVTDGPFLESKEALGGYYLVEADDLDAAIAIARDVPAPAGCVEVRAVQVFD